MLLFLRVSGTWERRVSDLSWQGDERVLVDAPARAVWARLSDVPSWRVWNSGIEWIEIHGPFADGTTFTMKPPGGEPLSSCLTHVVPYEQFTDATLVDD